MQELTEQSIYLSFFSRFQAGFSKQSGCLYAWPFSTVKLARSKPCTGCHVTLCQVKVDIKGTLEKLGYAL